VKELFELIEARQRARGVPHVVATVLRVEGSSYRRPGARMLINVHGRIAGSVSGGCLEKAVVSEGRRCLMDGRPRLLSYDTTDQDDLAIGTSLGCQGKIWIGLEVLQAHARWALESIASQIHDRRKPAALITRLHEKTDSVLFGTHAVFEDEDYSGDEAVSDVLEKRKANFVPGKESSALIEWVAPPLSLLLFGAGPDVLPMLNLGMQMGHEVTVIDRRPEFAIPENFPGARRVLLAKPHQLADVVKPDAFTVGVLMNHHYDTDRDSLASLIPLGLPYLAVLGPKRRTKRILDELQSEGHEVDGVAESLHGPAGLDIGAETPGQIALAILAEIQATLSRRKGGKLRERNAPIHSESFSRQDPICPVLV
jgi:xanthine dehydrogenase accessory factor